MKIYLISNNLLLDNINYDNEASLEEIRMVRPLSVKGELIAEQISNLNYLSSVSQIYASFYSNALGTAKYLSRKLELPVQMNSLLNECQVGTLGSKNMKMVKGLQDHEFTYKLPGGESLIDVGNRLNKFISSITNYHDIAIFTHKRAILGYLLKFSQVGYNLDDNLILEYQDKIIYDDSETDYDIYEVTIENGKIVDITRK